MTDEELKVLLKTQNLDIKDLAKLAKFLKSDEADKLNEEPKEAKINTKPVIGYTFEGNYPDFTITKTTAKTVKQLVFMVSQNSFFIRNVTNNKTPIETLDAENYAAFTSGMADITVDDFWLTKIKSGKRFYEALEEYLRKSSVHNHDHEMIKNGVCKLHEYQMTGDGYWNNASTVGNLSNVVSHNSDLLLLIKTFATDPDILQMIPNNSHTLTDLIKTFGIQNVRDLLKESKISLINLKTADDPNGSYWYRDDHEHNSWRPIECLDFNRFKEYILYESVRLGYRTNFHSFIRTWHDDLTMQRKIYGEVKEKYPHNLQTHHDQMEDRYALAKEEIDAKNFAKNSKIAEQYVYTMKDGDYTFLAPHTKDDFIDEAHQQANCLASYVSKFADGKDIIMFMRNKETPERSEVTIEIINGEVTQAYQASNRNVNNIQKAAIQEWCKKFKLNCDRI